MTSSVLCRCRELFLFLLAPPLFASDSGFFVFVDPLLWKGELGGASVAIATHGEPTLLRGKKSDVENLHFHLDWGFRIGVGYTTCCDGWEPKLVWTHWSNRASRSLFDPSVPIGGKATWELSYDILDLENGRNCCIGSCFRLRPHAGVRSAWVDQKEIEQIRQKDRSWGIGIRGGVDMEWVCTSYFSLFTNYAGSLLYSYHSVKYDEIHNFFHIGNAIFDAQLGIRIAPSCRFNVDLGWENHWLPGQNQFMLFVDDAMPGKFVQNQGDLGITGVFLRAYFSF